MNMNAHVYVYKHTRIHVIYARNDSTHGIIASLNLSAHRARPSHPKNPTDACFGMQRDTRKHISHFCPSALCINTHSGRPPVLCTWVLDANGTTAPSTHAAPVSEATREREHQSTRAPELRHMRIMCYTHIYDGIQRVLYHMRCAVTSGLCYVVLCCGCCCCCRPNAICFARRRVCDVCTTKYALVREFG